MLKETLFTRYKSLVLILGLSLSVTASAQDYTGDMGISYTNIGMSGAMMDAATESSAREVNSSAASVIQGASSFAQNSEPREYLSGSTEYTPSKKRRRENLSQFVEKSRAQDPKGAKQMAEVFAQSDVIEVIGKGIARYGLRLDNAADAYTLYWITAWKAAHGQADDPTNGQVAQVKAQAESALLSTPEFVNASDTVKQEMSEAYMVQALVISQYMDLAKTNPKLKPQIATAVRKGARASGLDLNAMTLTDEGFVLARKGSDASDAVPRAPDSQTKSLAEASVENNDTTTYALIAAAGAGTLAAVFGLGKVMGRRG